MDRVLDDIEFLARSANRVDVLRLVADRTYTRAELAEATDASQPTLGRILRDFEQRQWIRHHSKGYSATATGRLVAEGLDELFGSLETEHTLRELVEWLPTDALDFDLRRLQDATVTVPTQTRPGAPVSRVIDLIRDADSVFVLSHAFNDRTLAAVADWVAAGGSFEGVFSVDAITPVTDDDALARQLRRLAEHERASLFLYDGAVPLAVTLTDDVLSLLLRDEAGRLQAALDTNDPVVHEWAESVYTEYREESRPLDCEQLDDEPQTDLQ